MQGPGNMKRIRNEQIHSSVGCYLKKRQYKGDSEAFSKKDIKLRHTVQEMSLASVSRVCTGLDSAISFSSISGDVTACDQQYVRLRTFISEAAEPFKSELMPLLYPVFVHVYLELICNGHKTPAHKFYQRYHAPFLERADYRPVVEALSHLYNKDDVLESRGINMFREEKYKANISEDATQYLFRHLKCDDNVLMLQIFNHHIRLKVNSTTDQDLDLGSSRNSPFLADPGTPKNKVITNEESVSALRNCIKQVREGPPCLPSICFYTFINAFRGLSTCCISPNRTKICGGFEDSSVRLWGLLPKQMQMEESNVRVDTIHMSGDYVEDIQEREKQRCSIPSECQVLRAHSGSVYGTCFTPDSKFLLSSSEDKTVRLWNLKSFSNQAIYRGHNYPVWDVDISPLGSLFASCSMDRTARLWSTDRTYPLRTYVGHTMDVDSVKFHPNSNYIATGSTDKTVRLWSVQEGKCVRLMQGHRSSIFSLAFSPDGQLLASAGDDRRIKLWDLNSGSLLKELRGHTDTIYSLCFSKDSAMLASGGLDCMIRLWDVRRHASVNHNTSETYTSAELMESYSTKSTGVYHLQFTRYNLLLAAGTMAQ